MGNQNIVWHQASVTREQRQQLKGHKPAVLWFTGLSGSGKSTIANAVELKLNQLSVHSYLLDGDNVRHGLNRDLGFSDEDRIENIRRIGEVARLFVDSGSLVLTAFISPFIADRKQVRTLLPEGEFIEVFVDTPIETCELRDPKGLYKKARKGEIEHFTGLTSDYEAPQSAEIHLKTDQQSIEDSAEQVVQYLRDNGYV
ncbi:adenylyl-sulfate kinase [Vibrio comitans]|uniref:Adenylyl-sulfate kinase n=1 Tax=Vibrio comitans NBRC 102076 TaxID=1219078 RepID=A0A4Y3IS28_9VIBR|nr:adenylyl-sulfate kinase [Vibrio comitans]GEA62017.1 putative adenylyl-sulfate kinase [Vibrio comitans NBRC 102076]